MKLIASILLALAPLTSASNRTFTTCDDGSLVPSDLPCPHKGVRSGGRALDHRDIRSHSVQTTLDRLDISSKSVRSGVRALNHLDYSLCNGYRSSLESCLNFLSQNEVLSCLACAQDIGLELGGTCGELENVVCTRCGWRCGSCADQMQNFLECGIEIETHCDIDCNRFITPPPTRIPTESWTPRPTPGPTRRWTLPPNFRRTPRPDDSEDDEWDFSPCDGYLNSLERCANGMSERRSLLCMICLDDLEVGQANCSEVENRICNACHLECGSCAVDLRKALECTMEIATGCDIECNALGSNRSSAAISGGFTLLGALVLASLFYLS